MVTPKEFWNRRAPGYDASSGVTYAKTNQKTAQLALKYLKEDDRVLEFACGTGTIALQVAPHVERYRAIDISDGMVALARDKLARAGLTHVQLSQTDLFDPGLEEGGFDAVLAFNVLCYLPDRAQGLEGVCALLRPGGMFLSASDCLGEKFTWVGLKKFWKSRTGRMPYVAFDTMQELERAVAAAGFDVLERENLYPAPPNLFLAARKI